jgi:hypothetical protein
MTLAEALRNRYSGPACYPVHTYRGPSRPRQRGLQESLLARYALTLVAVLWQFQSAGHPAVCYRATFEVALHRFA